MYAVHVRGCSHSDVEYGDSSCGTFPSGVCAGCGNFDIIMTHHYWTISDLFWRLSELGIWCTRHGLDESYIGTALCPNWGCRHYSDIPAGGDVCGGRAFWGRFVRKGFGLPTWGATEHAHASLSAWTPTGWERLLGSNWGFCWWGDQSGQVRHRCVTRQHRLGPSISRAFLSCAARAPLHAPCHTPCLHACLVLFMLHVVPRLIGC